MENKTNALELLKSMQGDKTVLVPLIVGQKMLHEGIGFRVGVLEYNNFLNMSQSPKSTMTAAAATFLKQTVVDDDKEILAEALKVPGLLDYFIGAVMEEVAPELGEALD